MAGAVLFYGGLAADVLLFAGIGDQLVARLAAPSRLVATIGNGGFCIDRPDWPGWHLLRQ